MPLLWCGVARGTTLLAQNSAPQGAVDKLAKSILAKKPTAGWEFASSGGLKAVKLHVYATRDLVFSASCVHDGESAIAKGFLEKLMLMTEPLQEMPSWQSGGHLAAQGDCAAMLQQRLDQANSMGKLAMVNSKVDEVKGIMNENIQVLLENHARVEVLENKSEVTTSTALHHALHAPQARAPTLTGRPCRASATLSPCIAGAHAAE